MTRARDYSNLPKEERRLVFFARWANANTWNGGCAALIAAEAQEHSEAIDVVGEVYSRSSGKVPDHLDAWECPECGSVHYGKGSAAECCALSEEDVYDDDN